MRKIILLSFSLATLTLFSCNEKNDSLGSSSTAVSEAFNPRKTDTLGSRYNELGRFSGSILVAEEGEILYQKFFGKADYEKDIPFTEKTVFSLGPFSEFIKSKTGQQLQQTDSLETELQKGTAALLEELKLQNSFLQKEIPENAAMGYVHHIGPNGPQTTPVAYGEDLQLWTNAEDLAKIISEIVGEALIQNGYDRDKGFSYAIRKKGDLTVIVLSNRRHPVAGEMAESIEHLWEREPYQLPLLRKETGISSTLLEEYAGTYEIGPGAELKVITENDSLFVFMGPQKVHLKPQSENQFFMANTEAAIRFERDSTGKVASAELLDGFLTGNKIQKSN